MSVRRKQPRQGDRRNQTGMLPLPVVPCPHPAKASYATKARAKLALMRMTAVANRGAMHAYRCPCGRWHLGHQRRAA